MTDHQRAGNDSRALCDLLYELLSLSIADLQRSEAGKWCGLYQDGRNRFAYVNHRKEMKRCEIWCLGLPADLRANARLHIEPRQPSSGGFGKHFEARFFVNSESDVRAAVELLLKVSYELS